MSDDEIRAQTLAIATAYQTLLAQGKWDAWTELWAEDGVLEFPFAPPGRQSVYRGKAEIAAYMKAASGKMKIDGIAAMRVSPLLDPHGVTVELAVTGAMLKTGRRVAAQLRAAGHDVRAASRHGDVPFDWTARETWDNALDGVHAVYLVAPPAGDAVTLVTSFVQAAMARDVQRFVLLSASILEAGGFGMGQVHAHLRDHAKEWAVLRPTWFMQNFSEGTHLKAILQDSAIYSATGDGRVPFIDASDIAACAVECLTRAQAPNADFVLTSDRAISYDEVAAKIGAAIGRRIVHARVSIEELAERHKAVGVQPFTAHGLAVMDGAIANGIEDRTTGAVAALTGRPPASFDAFVRANVAAWTMPEGAGGPAQSEKQ